MRRPPRSTLFPYPPLFRSEDDQVGSLVADVEPLAGGVVGGEVGLVQPARRAGDDRAEHALAGGDRKSTRLNSSHANISYAVFCLKKKKKYTTELQSRQQLY